MQAARAVADAVLHRHRQAVRRAAARAARARPRRRSLQRAVARRAIAEPSIPGEGGAFVPRPNQYVTPPSYQDDLINPVQARQVT